MCSRWVRDKMGGEVDSQTTETLYKRCMHLEENAKDVAAFDSLGAWSDEGGDGRSKVDRRRRGRWEEVGDEE